MYITRLYTHLCLCIYIYIHVYIHMLLYVYSYSYRCPPTLRCQMPSTLPLGNTDNMFTSINNANSIMISIHTIYIIYIYIYTYHIYIYIHMCRPSSQRRRLRRASGGGYSYNMIWYDILHCNINIHVIMYCARTVLYNIMMLMYYDILDYIICLILWHWGNQLLAAPDPDLGRQHPARGVLAGLRRLQALGK